ncbi:MAG: TonB-dependent receptor plug domain-containing protein [Sphingobacteriales bacterium]|nr:TonB-dependent receptor plug domain-containing protein [Sphingobacteriales bacterium]
MLFSVLASCLVLVGYAQQRTVTGTVMDEDGTSLSGISYSVKGTGIGGVTKEDGSFSVSVNSNSIIVFSGVGFTTQEIKVGNQQTIAIVLVREETKKMEEVVVTTALGIRKKQKELGYSTTSVKPDEIQRSNTINVVNALQGKVAGVNINAVGTSGVTSSSSITIRGAKSIDKNNSPIFVIDGIVMENNITDTYGGKDWGSQLKNLNPDDYESINILKGAAATALYGSRGANGAIVITSKGGRARRGLGIELSQTYQVQKIYSPHIKLQNIYGAGSPHNGFQGDFLADGNPNKTTYSWGPKMDGTW